MIYLVLIIFVLIGGALAVLAAENLSDAHLTLFMWQVPHFPLGLLLLSAFLLGAALLYIVSALSALQDRGELKRLRKRIAELENASAKPSNGSPQGSSTQSAPVVPIPGLPPTQQQ